MLKNLTPNKVIVVLLVLLATMSGASTALGQQRPSPASASSNRSAQSDAITVFRSARDLITDGNWAKAQEKFSEYVASYPNEKNIEAALYWLAYTQQKLARYDQCRSTIDQLLEKYPNTTWKEDARLLLAQMPASAVAYEDLVSSLTARAITVQPAEARVVYAPGAPVSPVAVTPVPAPPQGVQGVQAIAPEQWVMSVGSNDSADDNDPCEFKIVVLQALFETDVQRGIMAATEWLKPGSTQTVRCKGAALSLLGRHGGKTVTPVILGVARSEPDLKLRARAISALGATNDDSVVDALREFALNSQDQGIVEASLYALSKHTGERAVAVLGDIAISGKMTSVRKIAIANISIRPGEPAVDTLFRIYDADQSLEIRKAVISGFGNRKSERAGNRLFEIARSSDNLELRKAAISAISRRGGDKAVEFLLSLYDTEKNEVLKDQIINSLGYGTAFYVGNFVDAQAVLEAGAAAGAGAGTGQGIGFGTNSRRMNDQRVIRKLIEIARSPQAPMERRKRAIGWLSRSKDPEVLRFLEELLKQQ
ncbi:MAG TPA: HEAT repeat domain-containing protein [Pyrinomonadaceae bacterium]|nr:HEAT repeat domain-containing protein [Pyrinomonadaceae bacterium]